MDLILPPEQFLLLAVKLLVFGTVNKLWRVVSSERWRARQSRVYLWLYYIYCYYFEAQCFVTEPLSNTTLS